MAEANVLVVDDEPEFLESVAERLGNRGFWVDTAGDGAQALKKIQQNLYDAVVLDLKMPKVDGLETLRQALAQKPELQIILLTGHASVKHGVEAMRLGAMDFLEKPADLDLLAEKILEGKNRRREIDAQEREAAVMDALKKFGW